MGEKKGFYYANSEIGEWMDKTPKRPTTLRNDDGCGTVTVAISLWQAVVYQLLI